MANSGAFLTRSAARAGDPLNWEGYFSSDPPGKEAPVKSEVSAPRLGFGVVRLTGLL